MPRQEPSVHPLLILVPLFLLALACLAYVFTTFPPLSDEEWLKIKLPRQVKDVQEMGLVISKYTGQYFTSVLLGYSLTYLFLQTFSIPGSIFLSFLAGSLFGLPLGVFLVCFLSACGASGSYWISYFFGRPFLEKYFPDKMKLFGEQVHKNRENLWNYFLFLRFSPFLPNWFVNWASPVFFIPFKIFWFGTFIGVSAQTFMAVKAGLTLQDIKEVSDILDIRAFGSLFGLAILSLLPTLKPVQNFLDRVLLRQKSPSPEKAKPVQRK